MVASVLLQKWCMCEATEATCIPAEIWSVDAADVMQGSRSVKFRSGIPLRRLQFEDDFMGLVSDGIHALMI